MNQQATTDTPSRTRALAASAVASAAILGAATLAAPAPASAHPMRGLGAKLLTANYVCDELTWPFCTIEGRVRVRNNRATTLVICVGIDVFTAGNRNLSIGGPTPEGQAIVRVPPRTSRVTTYKVLFDDTNENADRVKVTHVHKHIVQGGRQC
jgi:hypothetical protein